MYWGYPGLVITPNIFVMFNLTTRIKRWHMAHFIIKDMTGSPSYVFVLKYKCKITLISSLYRFLYHLSFSIFYSGFFKSNKLKCIWWKLGLEKRFENPWSARQNVLHRNSLQIRFKILKYINRHLPHLLGLATRPNHAEWIHLALACRTKWRSL
jgi:hypothetical protein